MPNHIQTNITLYGSTEDIDQFWNLFKVENIEDKLTKTVRKIQVDDSTEPPKPKYEIDLNKVIPMPSELNIEAEGLHTLLASRYSQDNDLIAAIQTVPEDVVASLTPANLKEFIASSCPKTSQATISRLETYSEESYGNFCQAIKNLRKFGYPSWYEWRVENWGTKWNAYQQSRTSANEFSFQTAWSHPSPIIDLLSKMFRSIVFRVKYADEDKGHNLGHYTIQSGVVTYRDDFEAGSQAAQRFSCDVWGYEYEQWLADHS